MFLIQYTWENLPSLGLVCVCIILDFSIIYNMQIRCRYCCIKIKYLSHKINDSGFQPEKLNTGNLPWAKKTSSSRASVFGKPYFLETYSYKILYWSHETLELFLNVSDSPKQPLRVSFSKRFNMLVVIRIANVSLRILYLNSPYFPPPIESNVYFHPISSFMWNVSRQAEDKRPLWLLESTTANVKICKAQFIFPKATPNQRKN